MKNVFSHRGVMFISLFLSIIFSNTIFSQSGLAKSLKIGDMWVYSANEHEPYTFLRTAKVIGDTIIGDYKYAILIGHNYRYQRADSQNIYRYSLEDSTEFSFVNFNIQDSSHYSTYYHLDTVYFWGEDRKRISSIDYDSRFTYTINYIYGMGANYYDLNGLGSLDYTSYLVAAKLDNKIYGESTLVGINKTEALNPHSFKLFQNYPNPFNPSTIISYSIPKQSNVSLKIFDVLGNEITTLVNEEQSIGNYNVEFDGSNLTGGVYFYRLESGDFTETKKLILLR